MGNPGLILFILVIFNNNFIENCRLQRDSNWIIGVEGEHADHHCPKQLIVTLWYYGQQTRLLFDDQSSNPADIETIVFLKCGGESPF